MRAVEAFCTRWGRVDWVVGTDLGGTDSRSLARLLRLQKGHAGSRVRVMKLRGAAIFHPKMYWLSTPRRQLVVLGSANLTNGGMGNNLEASLRIETRDDEDQAQPFLRMMNQVWEQVNTGRAPLSPADLIPLDDTIVARIGRYYAATREASRRRPPHPLSRQRGTRESGRGYFGGTHLAMELTLEQGLERLTQVQPPRTVWEKYFRVDLSNPGALSVRRELPGARYDTRPVVKHYHVYTIELPGADVPRPAVVLFKRLGRRRYQYSVFTPRQRGYGAIVRLLQTTPNPWRTGRRERLWAIY